MSIIALEFRSQLKRTFIYIVIFSAIIISSLIAARVLCSKGVFNEFPHMLSAGFSFLELEELSTEMKTFLILMSVLSFPILYYAITITMYSLEIEEDTGTIVFLLDNPIARKEIIVVKYLVGIVNYIVNIIIQFIIATILITLSYSDSAQKKLVYSQMIHIGVALLVVGILLASIGTFYASVKRKESSSGIFATSILLWTTFIGLIPYFLQFGTMLIERKGKNVEVFAHIIEKIGILKYFSVSYWCNPIIVYENGMKGILFIISGITTILFLFIAIFKYNKREFGE